MSRGARGARMRWGVPTGVVLGVVLVLVVAMVAGTGSASTTGYQPVKGLPFKEPARIVSSNGVLRATLVAEERKVTVSGDTILARVYNGAFTGPTLVVKPGDTMRITLVNKLSEETNLHFHGLHVSPSGSADNVFIHVEPGKSFTYVVHIPSDAPTGLAWYHSHMHHLSEEQVFGGLSGMLVVDGITRLLPPSLRHITHRELALRDLQVTNGAVSAHQNLNTPSFRFVNSLLDPAMTIAPGETQLWSIANIGANTFYKLSFGGRAFHVVAEDGRPVWRVWSAKTLLMPPGKRYEVLMQGPPKGTYQLKSLAFDAGATAGSYTQTVLATVTSAGTALTPATLPTSVGPKEDLSSSPIAKTFDLTFGRTGFAPLKFTLNGKTYDPNRIDARAKLGTVQEWHLHNATGDWHPFHMHTDYFQVMSVDGVAYHARGLQDTVLVPPHATDVVIRIEFEDFTGETVYHCHILNHEDHGMMANILISK